MVAHIAGLDLELIIIFLTCFLSVTTLALLQYWSGQKAEFAGNSIRLRHRYIDWGKTSTCQYYTDLYFESFGEK